MFMPREPYPCVHATETVSMCSCHWSGTHVFMPREPCPCVHATETVPMCSCHWSGTHVFMPREPYPCVHATGTVPMCSCHWSGTHVFMPREPYPCVHATGTVPMCSCHWSGTHVFMPLAPATVDISAEPPGACFSKHDGPSDQVTDHPPMLFVHSRMVRRPVGQSFVLIETAPRTVTVHPSQGKLQGIAWNVDGHKRYLNDTHVCLGLKSVPYLFTQMIRSQEEWSTY